MAGLEVLFCSAHSQINCSSNALVCCLHWNAIANDFKCIGVGEKLPSDQTPKKSELLPSGWDTNSDVYSLLYQPSNGDDVYLLKLIRMDDSMLVHFMRLKDDMVASMNIRISDYVGDDLSTYDRAFKNLEDLQKKFKKEIIDELKPADKGQRSSSSQQARTSERRPVHDVDDDPLRVGPRRGPGGCRYPQPQWTDPMDPFSIGRGDLDPLAGGMGGGMVMDPFQGGRMPGVRPNLGAGLPGRLPPGAVPPGARFDPFGLPDPDDVRPGGRRPGPDHDHFSPPGFNDDMFM